MLYFVTGHKGFETLLFHEVRQILEPCNSAQIKKVYGGIQITGSLEPAYLVCLHSRLANRVYLQLAQFKAEDEEQLYQAVYGIDWTSHLDQRKSFAVSATLSRSNINHQQYACYKVKDAVVDFFRDRSGGRPIIDKAKPDIHIHLNIHQNSAVLSLDLSGQSLHRRGYRLQHAGAPLKENLAAALLAQSGWSREKCKRLSLVDPMCGSGTFVIEAAMIAANIAPGLDRNYFGFSGWAEHDVNLWQQCLDDAENQIDESVEVEIVGLDSDDNAIQIAKDNAMRAGVSELIQFTTQPLSELPQISIKSKALVISNPPYGERLQTESGLGNLYNELGQGVRSFKQASLHIISANPDLLHRLRLKRTFKKAVKNGPLSCIFASFEVADFISSSQEKASSVQVRNDQITADRKLDKSPEGTALENRLKKNYKHLSRWAKRNGISCYRLYDADLPEFAFVLEVFTSELDPSHRWFHMQEYQAPKTIDEAKAVERFELAQQVVKQLFGIDETQLFCKQKHRQRGKTQYIRHDKQGELFQIAEVGASLLVNLSDYVDTGLFLDHRITRQKVSELAQGKTLLNLFCYTGSVSVFAALAGASQVTSVDLSSSYLNWARENFELNNLLDEQKYLFIQADILQLLSNPIRFGLQQKYDLIFLDPPSFSNSKKMRDTLDIQRDHVELIDKTMQLLNPEGVLFFSTNKKRFKLDSEISSSYQLTDISQQTIPEDFKRKPGIHCCWLIRHK